MSKVWGFTRYIHVHVVVRREVFIAHIANRRHGYSAGKWVVGGELMVLHAIDRACRDREINL